MSPKNGDLELILNECKEIQKRLLKDAKKEAEVNYKAFLCLCYTYRVRLAVLKKKRKKDKETLETLQPKNMLSEDTRKAVTVARIREGRSSVSL